MAGRDTNIGAKRARQLREEVELPLDVPAGCLLTLAEERLGIPVNFIQVPEGVIELCWQLNPQRGARRAASRSAGSSSGVVG